MKRKIFRGEIRLSTLISLIITTIIVFAAGVFLLYAYNSVSTRIDTLLHQEFNSDMKVTDIIIQERYKDMIENELDSISEHIKSLLAEGSTLKSISNDSPINFSNKIDIAFIKPFEAQKFYDISFSVLDTTYMIKKIVRQKINTNSSVILKHIDEIGDIMLGSKKIIDPTSGRVLGRVCIGVVFDHNFSFLEDIKKLTNSDMVALFSNNKMISNSGTSQSSDELLKHVKANRDTNIIYKYNNSVFTTKDIFFNGKPTDLKITFVKSSNIFEELRDDSIKSIVVVILLIAFTIIGLEILIRKLFVNPLEKLHSFAKSDVSQSKNYKFAKTPVKEINEIGVNLQTFIYTLQKINRELQIKVDEELEKVREKDRIIHAQSRQSSLLELLLNLAHQWRQPLNVIALKAINIEDILDFESYNKQQIKKITKSIVEDIKELSDLITEFTIFYEKNDDVLFSVHDEINTSLRFLPYFELTIYNQADINLLAKGDPKAFVEIVSAIVKNSQEAALKRKIENPKITITIKQEGEQILIHFKDNCGGIEREIEDKIFEPYTTTNFKSRNKGLGLFMAQNLANYRLDGTISAINQDGGALFTLKVKNGTTEQLTK